MQTLFCLVINKFNAVLESGLSPLLKRAISGYTFFKYTSLTILFKLSNIANSDSFILHAGLQANYTAALTIVVFAANVSFVDVKSKGGLLHLCNLLELDRYTHGVIL